jgi:hypothetical protein
VDIRYEGIPAGIEAQVRRTEAMASGRERDSPEVWKAREALWMRAGDGVPSKPGVPGEPDFGSLGWESCICKFSVLPAELGALSSLPATWGLTG